MYVLFDDTAKRGYSGLIVSSVLDHPLGACSGEGLAR